MSKIWFVATFIKFQSDRCPYMLCVFENQYLLQLKGPLATDTSTEGTIITVDATILATDDSDDTILESNDSDETD